MPIFLEPSDAKTILEPSDAIFLEPSDAKTIFKAAWWQSFSSPLMPKEFLEPPDAKIFLEPFDAKTIFRAPWCQNDF